MIAATAHADKTIDGLRLMSERVSLGMHRTLEAAVAAAEMSAKRTERFRDRTGKTRASIKSRVTTSRGFVKAGGASRFLEEGTVAHIIAARRASSLRFVVNGHAVYRRWVHHPGTKPRPFMADARNVGEMAVPYAAREFIGAAIRGR